MIVLQPQRFVFLLVASLTLAGISLCAAQTLNKPTPDFTNACASSSFNEFAISFTWQAPAVASDNQFILELSDANGSFSNPVALRTLSDKNSTYEFKFLINFATDIAGDSYKVRVRSTNPSLTSPESDPFSAYYMRVNQSLVINNYQEASVCDGNSYVLSVDNYPDEPAYNWYKDMSLIPGERSAFLEVTEPGIYFAELDYGDHCSVSTSSNLVEVFAESAIGISLLGDATVNLCQGEVYTLTANINDPNLLYQWYKDGNLLVQDSNHTFDIDASSPGFEGEYYLIVQNKLTACEEASNKINIQSTGFDTGIETPDGVVLIPGEPLALQATTTAGSPSYEWYKNDVLITGASSAQFTVTSAGTYKAKIIASGSCVAEKFTPEVTVVAPDSYAVTMNTSAYSECMTGSLTLGLDKIEAVAGTDTYVLQASSLDQFTYQWTLNGAPLTGETGRTLTISGQAASGIYNLNASIGAQTYSAEALDVKMGITESPLITSALDVTCNDGTLFDITSNMTDMAYTYAWLRNGVELTESSPSLQTSLPGTYQMIVRSNGCEVASNQVVVTEINSDMVQLDAPAKFSVPEGESRTVTATGADSYVWLDANYQELSVTSSVTLSEEGQYLLRAMVGNCEVLKTIELTYQLSYTVPNAITPNGDGFNDLWILPSAYAYQPDILVTIFDESGVQVFSALEYQNNWPQSMDNMTFKGGRPPIYYYTITKGKDIVKRGTITVVK